jgi:F420-dependent oxidoreductase-like protein
MDHYFQMEARAPAEEPMLEGYTGLGYLAGVTSKLQLGLLVTGVTYRHPGLLAKIVATLDVLSEGRAFLGIGAAWYEREHLALGVPYPPLKERFERLEETLQIVQQMWSDDDGPYSGTHYQLAETLCHPAPLQSPRPPILIGGSGEKKTLRLVAQYGDACNLFDAGPDAVAHKIEVLRGHCADVGRDPSEIDITVTSAIEPDRDGFLERMRTYAGLGVSQAWVSIPPENPTEFVERACTDVLPELARF